VERRRTEEIRMELRERVALVTGASSGIGRAVAGRLADAGARVLAHGRDPARVDEVARAVGGAGYVADLAEPGGARVLADRVLADHPQLDVLVANAGFGWSGPFAAMPADRLDAMVTVDLAAPLVLARALLPGMVERGRGHLVLVSSVAGRTGVAGEAAYAACKAGLDAFAESLRLELRGTGVGVGVVVPAAVHTPFFETRGRSYDRAVPRPVSAERVADAVLDALRAERAEVWVPGWLRAAAVVRAVAPATYRRLAARFGEPVRVGDDPGSGR
jgi:short-subunit dehydrogenase